MAEISGTGRAWTELCMDNLRHNVRTLTALLPPGCALMPAVKADAYGHGAVPIARELNRLGIRAFCVASAGEGAALRQAGVTGTILVLGYTHPSEFDLLARCGLTQAVVDCGYAQLLEGSGRSIEGQLAIDTGMHRLGERSERFDRILSVFRMRHLRITGVFTHLCADENRSEACRAITEGQASAFRSVVCGLRAAGYRPKAHLLSSYGLLNYPALGGDFARVGIALYGVLSTAADTAACLPALRPVLSLKTRVSSLRALHPGEGAGYGPDFSAAREMTIAALSIGYADGLPRSLSNGVGSVLLHGCRAPILGRVCMDQTLVDVSGIPGVRPGDAAVLIGSSGDLAIGAADLAAQAGTITNEILSRLGPRLERVII